LLSGSWAYPIGSPSSSKYSMTGRIQRSMAKNDNNSDVEMPRKVATQMCDRASRSKECHEYISQHAGSVVTSGTSTASWK